MFFPTSEAVSVGYCKIKYTHTHTQSSAEKKKAFCLFVFCPTNHMKITTLKAVIKSPTVFLFGIIYSIIYSLLNFSMKIALPLSSSTSKMKFRDANN